MVCLERNKTVSCQFKDKHTVSIENLENASTAIHFGFQVNTKSLHCLLKIIPVREEPGLVGLCDDDDDSCLKNSLGFMERWDTNTAASYMSINAQLEKIK